MVKLKEKHIWKKTMTGKKITNTVGKGQKMFSTSKNPIKQMNSTAAVTSSPMTGKVSSTSALTVTSTALPLSMSTLIKTSENIKYLPRYTTALTKSATELFSAEELDGIQLELEILLSTVALRYKSLKSSFDLLDCEDRTYKKNEKHASAAYGKRKRDDANKKTKSSNQSAKIMKIKTSPSDSPAHSQNTDDNADNSSTSQPNGQSSINNQQPKTQQNPKLLVPKNDIPNKFWLSVEPYCMPITQEDVKLLDDMIEEYSGRYSGPLVPPVPELGPHYASRWATEDLREEQDNSNPNAKANKRFTNAANPEVNNMLKKGEKVSSEKMMAEGITGPLTQRLVAALLEENLLNSKIGEIIGTNESSKADESNASNPLSSNQTNASVSMPIASLLKNGIGVELRLKKELIELGILDISDLPKEKDDEVLNEIKRVRTELESISEYNLNELKRLRSAAREEMQRLEIKRKLDAVDQELIESYKRVWAAKQKRRPLTKLEKTEIYRLIEEQKRLGDQLESMPCPSLPKSNE